MGSEDNFEKKIKKGVKDVADAMMEGREQIRVLTLSGDEVADVIEMDDQEIKELVASRGFDFDEHWIRIKTLTGESEQYMKSPEDLRKWLRIGSNLN